MALTALPLPDLAGQRASWLWRSATDQLVREPDAEAGAKVPVGLGVHHGDHELVLLWAPIAGFTGAFTLDSLAPLTIVQPIGCPHCGLTGWIKAGQWLSSSSSKGATA